MLGLRLKKCIDFVHRGGVTLDVGTDHGLIPIQLIKENISKYCIASDIAEGPLEAAKRNILENNMEEKIETCLSAGFENIDSCRRAKYISDIIIAGMGGETIADILSIRKDFVMQSNIILQPMTKVSNLRKWLYLNGFEIEKEYAVKDASHIYTCINCRYTGRKKEISDSLATAGFFDFDKNLSKEFAMKSVSSLIKKYNGIKNTQPFEAENILKTINGAKEIINES